MAEEREKKKNSTDESRRKGKSEREKRGVAKAMKEISRDVNYTNRNEVNMTASDGGKKEKKKRRKLRGRRKMRASEREKMHN